MDPRQAPTAPSPETAATPSRWKTGAATAGAWAAVGALAFAGWSGILWFANSDSAVERAQKDPACARVEQNVWIHHGVEMNLITHQLDPIDYWRFDAVFECRQPDGTFETKTRSDSPGLGKLVDPQGAVITQPMEFDEKLLNWRKSRETAFAQKAAIEGPAAKAP